MNNNLPEIFSGDQICIICEGDEEYEYLFELKSLGVWNPQYNIELKNAEGNGNIPARYQNEYQNGNYDLVLVFCDTDKKPYEQYEDIKRKINELHGNKIAAKEVIIFGNPCTMQIILQHWDDVQLTSHKTNKNAPIIESLTGVTKYKGREDQRKELFSKITKENYKEMKDRLQNFIKDDTVIGSSNFYDFLEYFTEDSDSWISKINEKIEVED